MTSHVLLRLYRYVTALSEVVKLVLRCVLTYPFEIAVATYLLTCRYVRDEHAACFAGHELGLLSLML